MLNLEMFITDEEKSYRIFSLNEHGKEQVALIRLET